MSEYNAGQHETSQRVRDVMSAVFGIDGSAIRADDSPQTIGEWDSVRHLQLMLALEEAFGIQFDASELATLGSVAVIEERLRAHAANG